MLSPRSFGNAGVNAIEGAADGVVAVEIELHTAHIGFVGEGVAVELEHHWVADGLGGGDRPCRRHRNLGRHHRNTVGRQHRLGVCLGENGLIFGLGLVQNGRHRRPIDPVVEGQRRGFVQPLEGIAVPPQEPKQPSRLVGVAVGGYARLVEDRFPLIHLSAPHPAGQNRLGGAAGPPSVHHRLGGGGGIGHGLGGEHYQAAVGLGVGQGGL